MLVHGVFIEIGVTEYSSQKIPPIHRRIPLAHGFDTSNKNNMQIKGIHSMIPHSCIIEAKQALQIQQKEALLWPEKFQ